MRAPEKPPITMAKGCLLLALISLASILLGYGVVRLIQ